MKSKLTPGATAPASLPPLPADDPPPSPAAASDDDMFDPAKLRVTGELLNGVGVERLLTTIPVRRPNKQIFIRVHPDEAYRLDTVMLELKEEGEHYLVLPSLVVEFDLPGARACRLYLYVDRNKTVALWPIPLPEAAGRENDWHRSAHAAAAEAMERWVRIVPDRSLNGYRIFAATGEIEAPAWPKEPMAKVLSIAFGSDRFIRTPDHAVIKRLRGAV